MISLIEINGQNTTVSLYTTMDKALEDMLRLYKERIKTIKRLNWNNSWIDLFEGFAKIDDWETIIEWRVTEKVTLL